MKEIFVFGSNTGGIHGGGAALYAKQNHGAKMGVGIGFTGSSYAIPTKRAVQVKGYLRVGNTLPLAAIKDYVESFKKDAKHRSDLIFKVTQIGCGLAGLKKEDIAPMFKGSPLNCHFDSAWKEFLGDKYTYWGTM